MYRIARREALTPSTFLWEVEAPDVATSARPGQFVMVRLHDGAERVPLTIADYDTTAGTVTVVVQALGRSTAEMRDHYDVGDEFADFVGPLGMPTEIEPVSPAGARHVVLVGGGLGVAPVFPQLRAFKQAGWRTTAIVGFRSADLQFWTDRLADWADELIVCTDDGSFGRPGLVTAALADVIAATPPPDLAVAIGPMVMMRACAEVTRPAGIHTVVSLNTIMVDGTGMCGSCRVTVDGVTRFACTEGPDFDAHCVDFDELVTRQRRFRSEERSAAPTTTIAARWSSSSSSRASAPTRSCARSNPPASRWPCATPKRARTPSTRSRSATRSAKPCARPNAACSAAGRRASAVARWRSTSRASSATCW